MMESCYTRSVVPDVNQPPSARAVVIGYGSPLRGDDGAGWHAAQQLDSSIHDPSIQIICVHQLAPELAEVCSQADLVIFMDASSSGNPGEISCVPVAVQSPASTPQAPPPSCSHHVTPVTLLTIAKQLYGREPRAYLLSIGGESFALGEELSATVKASLPQLLHQARSLLASLSASRDHDSR
jgi:hydrogenase maturation protease